jgi:hypothetical protein
VGGPTRLAHSPVEGFTDTEVSFTVSMVPSTVTARIAPELVTHSSESNKTYLWVTPGPTTKTEGWTYNLKITGTTKTGLVHSITVKLSVTR